MTPLLRFAATVQALALAAPAQVVADRPLGSELVSRLRSTSLKPGDAAEIVQQLQSHPLAIRLQASNVLRDQFTERRKRHDRAVAGVRAEIGKTLTALLKGRIGKRAFADADVARSAALAKSRNGTLTKTIIQQEIDPLVSQLEGLLWPTEAELGTAAFKKGNQLIVDERAELKRLHGLYAAALSGLELHPDAEKHFLKFPPLMPPPAADALADETVVWILLAHNLAEHDRKAIEANEALRPATDPEEFLGTTELNRLRFLLGLGLLRLDDRLSAAARDHSTDMVNLRFFDHTSPVEGKRTPSDRAANFGTSGGAENIHQGQGSGIGAIRSWWYSPGHHRNMLGDHARTGLGRHDLHWTQMFGG
ncbi:MAG: CAP domain-containing protein [Planctomycetes bacterium]|nr:CAP domain-containing protein [Planctomycetota bacterium]